MLSIGAQGDMGAATGLLLLLSGCISLSFAADLMPDTKFTFPAGLFAAGRVPLPFPPPPKAWGWTLWEWPPGAVTGPGRLGTWAGCPGTLGLTCPSCKCLYKRPGLPITLLAAGTWRGWNRQPGSGPGVASSKLATLGKVTSACPASVFSSVKQGWL